ncbi:MAG: ornithine cyclodeaminase family protein [Deltaproteobacteria bacterium]|nr:ornithine cyclodeaminase family protein [Deltaproteobacteria bacterium]
MLVLTRREIQRTISMREAIEAVKAAYLACFTGEASVPKRTTIHLAETRGISQVLPSSLTKMGVFGAKLVSVFFDNPRQGLPLVSAMIVLQDGSTGRPMAIMDGNLPTAIKTGAATGAATEVLARGGSESAGLIGTGYQAAWQLEAICEVRPGIREILVFDVDKDKARGFAREMESFLSRFHVRVTHAESPEQAVRGRDIIVTVTTSTTPVFDGEWISPGVHVNAVGSFTPEMQEIDEKTVMKADKIVTDVREEALEMTGDLIVPIRKGVVAAGVIHAEMGEVLAGQRPAREREDEITLFESVGLSALDVAVAKRIYQNASDRGIGHQIELN